MHFKSVIVLKRRNIDLQAKLICDINSTTNNKYVICFSKGNSLTVVIQAISHSRPTPRLIYLP